jgi:tRNA-specific 2-thiouridylase
MMYLTPPKKGRVIVGLSGGVDSAMAAWLLKQQGYSVVGLFMKNWEDDDDSEYCAARQDFIDAASVADQIGVEFAYVNFAAAYKERVFSDFLREYAAGRTPNPDVLCNAEIKFRAFLDHAMALGAEHIATGHYARMQHTQTAQGKTYQLLKALDATKDQSYFLHRLNQAQLARTLFPLGEMRKQMVRHMAQEIGLHNAAKKDSTGICFIGERPFRTFLERYLPTQPGPILTLAGQQVGQHQGLAFYTVGQRKGLGVGGIKVQQGQERTAQAWYVLRKDLEKNVLYFVSGRDHPSLQSHALIAQRASWVAGKAPEKRVYHAKTRYRQVETPCYLAQVEGDCFALRLDEPQWAVTPGQSAVLYDGERCLGGGVIA